MPNTPPLVTLDGSVDARSNVALLFTIMAGMMGAQAMGAGGAGGTGEGAGGGAGLVGGDAGGVGDGAPATAIGASEPPHPAREATKSAMPDFSIRRRDGSRVSCWSSFDVVYASFS